MQGNIARVETNLAGINELMSSIEVREFMQTAGESVARQANQMSGGDNFKAETKVSMLKENNMNNTLRLLKTNFFYIPPQKATPKLGHPPKQKPFI